MSPVRSRSRRMVAAAAVVSVTTLLAACAGSGGTTAPEDTSDASGEVSSDTKGTVRILMEEVPDTDIVQDLVPQFNEAYPDITIDIETLTFDQMRDKLVASFQSSEPTYDLIVVDNPWMVDFANAGFLAPLDSRIESTPDYDPDDFFDSLVDITTVDATRYGVPFYNYALGYIYRADLYEEAGLSEPATLDELVSNVQALKDGDRAGIAMQPQRGYKIFEEWGNWLFAAGGSIYDEDGNVTLDTPEAVTALEAYIEAFETAAPPNSLNWAFDEAQRSVSSDGAASMVGYNWNLPSLNAPEGPAGDLAGSFMLTPMPGGKQVLGSWSWAIPANSATPDAAWAFASWITSKDVEVDRVKAGGASIRQSVLEDESVLAEGFGEDYYAAVIQILSDAAPLTNGASGEEMIQAVGTELNEAVAGSKSVADALTAAQEAAERIQK